MGYKDNIQNHCTRLGIENPLQEKDLQVSTLRFFNQGRIMTISASDMNRAGRFFFQISVNRPEFTRASLIEHEALSELKAMAALFFAENWDDAELVGRPLLIALKTSDGMIIDWR